MKIGIIGAGAIVRRAHLPVLRNLQGAEVVAISDIDREQLDRVGSEFGIKRRFIDYEEVLKDDSIRLVDICTPTPTHHKIAMKALKAGKHIMIEKPLALSLKEAFEIYDEALRNKLKVCVVQNYRYVSAVSKARERLRDGCLGDVVTIHANALTHFPTGWTRGKWLYHKGGALYDFTPHLVDLVLWLNRSQVERVFVAGGDFSGGDMNFINYAQIIMEFANKSIVTADVSWLTGTLSFTLDIHGTAGHISLDVMKDAYFEFRGSVTPLDEVKRFTAKMRHLVGGVLSGRLFTGVYTVYNELFSDVIQCIETDSPPPASASDGVKVNLVLEAVEESLRQGRPITLREFAVERGISPAAFKKLWVS